MRNSLIKHIVTRGSIYSATLLFILCVILFPVKLVAQVSCIGDGCAYLPLSESNLNNMLTEMEKQYLNTLFDDMAEATAAANLAGPPIGTVNLSGFTFGANVSASVVKPYDVTVNIPNVGYIEDAQSAGGAFNGRIYLGLNLGALLGMSYDPFAGKKETPSFLSPARFDIYVSALDINETIKDNDRQNGAVKTSLYFRGFDLRYHLVEGGDMIGGPLLRFLGVSLGVGVYHSRQSISFEQTDSDLNMTIDNERMTWLGQNRLEYDAIIDTYPVELRTGIQLLYFLNLSIAGGVALQKGRTDFSVIRTGPVFVETDLLSALDLTSAEAILTMIVQGHGRVPARMEYLKVGLEFNIFAVKLSFEGIATKRTRAANVGIRLEI